MATKVIVLGEETPNESKKPIELKLLLTDCELTTCGVNPNEWENIELICRSYNKSGFDLMFAYDVNRNDGVLYLGHFNDGVV